MSFKPKNILVTGVAGFIGAAVLIKLVKDYPEYNIIGIDKLSYCSSTRNFEEVKNYSNFIYIKGDITNLDFIYFIFGRYQIDTVLHFAAYSHVDQSFGNSIIFTQNNVIGTHVLLEVSKNYNISLFLHVSTDEVYGNQAHNKSDEQSLLDPTNPYAATKAAAEHIVKSYYNSFKLPVIITRGNNVYGPKQYPEKVIPKFILRLQQNLKCGIHGKGQQMRSFMYIDDVVNAFDTILHKGKIGEIYNIGCSKEYSILSVAQKLIYNLKKTENYDEWITYTEDRCFNDQRYFITNSKLTQLGWKRQIDFKDGLQKTIDWYINNLNYWDTGDINRVIHY